MNDQVFEIVHRAGLIFKNTDFLRIVNEGKELEDGRYGGCLCIESDDPKSNEPPLLIALLGKIDGEEKKRKYFKYAQEKAKRLRKSPSEILTSWETRSPEKNRWGGAIRTKSHILSFSGLPEEADEAFVVLLAISCNICVPLEQITIKSGSSLIYNRILTSLGVAALGRMMN